MKLRSIIVLVLILFSVKSYAQLQPLRGNVIANDDVEGIHILNKTSVKYTVTDSDGTFQIPAQINDTLTISSLKYNIKEIVVTQLVLKQNNLKVYLTERITQLDEVVVGKILTGSLSSDINNLDVETPINFYDLGIPGYTGKHKTLGERKLAEATTGGGLIPLFPLLNAITGRTKQLKKQLQAERDLRCMERLKSEYANIIFDEDETSKKVINQFFYYIIDSEKFRRNCYETNQLNKISFLQTELKSFNEINPKD